MSSRLKQGVFMILGSYQDFLDRLFVEIDKSSVDVSGYELDHMAYQAELDEEYDKLSPEFVELGKMVAETIVSGRRVGIFMLRKPFKYKKRLIPVY